LKNLEELAIGGDQLTDHGLKGIEELQPLSSLSIYGDRITDEGIDFLSMLVNLRYVSLSGKNIGDASFRQLARLPDLQILHFVATGLSDNSFDRIELEACSTESHAPFPKLQILYVSNNSISDRWCSSVSRLSTLRTLDVSYSSITDIGFHQILRQCRGLTSLFASQCDLQGGDWISGEWSCEIETLAIGDDNLTGSDVMKLYRRHPSIKSILGYGCCISDSERSELRQFLRDRRAVVSR
jgi:hypothetical protein